MSTLTPIEMYEPLGLPPPVVRDALMAIMSAIAKHERPYERLERGVDLRDVHVPVDGQMRVPVDAEVENRPHRWECSLRLQAHEGSHLFPTFDGTLSVTPDGRNESEIWLQGGYRAPGGSIGKGIDVAALHGVAEHSLRRFLTWIAGEVAARAEQVEREARERARRQA